MGRENVKNTIVDKVLEFVAPHLCCGCGKTGVLLCDGCKSNIIKDSLTACILCGLATPGGVCHIHAQVFEKAWIVGPRSGTLQRLIGGFKFQYMKSAAQPLAELLDARLPALPLGMVCIPIPTAPSHIRERGYDHLSLVARQFAHLRRAALDTHLLKRHNTATQHSANRENRMKQAVDAFRIDGTIDPNTPYLLIDDVVTTGATITQAARLLSEAGARHVWVAAIARQPLD